jgi:hypothetical protein
MSLYSHEEVCVACIYAVFHNCCKSFCKCEIGANINGYDGTCSSKVYDKCCDTCDNTCVGLQYCIDNNHSMWKKDKKIR